MICNEALLGTFNTWNFTTGRFYIFAGNTMRTYLRISAFLFCIIAIVYVFAMFGLIIIGYGEMKAPVWFWLVPLAALSNLILSGIVNLFFNDR